MFAAQLPDQALVHNYLQGNESALAELINRHQQKVFTYIRMLVKDSQLAEDIFQDVFVKVIHTLKSGNYNEEGKFLPWIDIFRTIRNMDDNVEDKMVKEQILQDVKKLIKELPPEQQEVLILRHYADMSFQEIADFTNVSINTALGRMRYALINLRKIVKQKEIILSV